MFEPLKIQEKIGYVFRNVELLSEAFTHASFSNEHALPSYERLEFLGDSVLGMVVAAYLYERYPGADEGFLTKTKASIVSGKTLAAVIERLDLVQYLRVSSGNNETEVRSSKNIKEDLFEALVGAITVDGGIDESRKFILRELAGELSRTYTVDNVTDFKSKLLEKAVHKGIKAEFVVGVSPDDPKTFVAEVLFDGVVCASGAGASKKKAAQSAAEAALKKI